MSKKTKKIRKSSFDTIHPNELIKISKSIKVNRSSNLTRFNVKI